MSIAALLPPVEERRSPIPISAGMLVAGRRAFMKQRKTLNDLYDFYDCDLDAALRHIFREMSRARL